MRPMGAWVSLPPIQRLPGGLQVKGGFQRARREGQGRGCQGHLAMALFRGNILQYSPLKHSPTLSQKHSANRATRATRAYHLGIIHAHPRQTLELRIFPSPWGRGLRWPQLEEGRDGNLRRRRGHRDTEPMMWLGGLLDLSSQEFPPASRRLWAVLSTPVCPGSPAFFPQSPSTGPREWGETDNLPSQLLALRSPHSMHTISPRGEQQVQDQGVPLGELPQDGGQRALGD